MSDSPGAHLGRDLMGGPPPTLLPTDPAAAELASGAQAHDVVRRHPESPFAWATLAEEALADADADDVTAYAYARVGYHRSLDALRRNGWKGHGPVPWEHEPNRGFLRSPGRARRGRRPHRRGPRAGPLRPVPARLQPRGARPADLSGSVRPAVTFGSHRSRVTWHGRYRPLGRT